MLQYGIDKSNLAAEIYIEDPGKAFPYDNLVERGP